MNTSHKSKQDILKDLEELRFIISVYIVDPDYTSDYEEAIKLLEAVIRYVNKSKRVKTIKV
jgi:hypothetical protein